MHAYPTGTQAPPKCDDQGYYFSYSDFLRHRQLNSSCICSYLSLGETIGHWSRATVDSALEEYRCLIEESERFLSTLYKFPVGLNRTQILVGDMCMSLAGRIARARKQAELIPIGALVIPKMTLGIPSKFPVNSLQSYTLIESEEFGSLIEVSVLRIFRGCSPALSISQAEQPRIIDREMTFVKKAYIFLSRALAPITRRSRILIVASYVGRVREALLNLRLGQAPLLTELRNPPRERGELRDHSYNFGDGTRRDLRKALVSSLIPATLRQPWVRRTEELVKAGWPTSPQVIFTSNSFRSDDDFKQYLANHWESASYVVGQHGNNYGVTNQSETYPETWLSDLFLTWGWSSGADVFPIGNLKPSERSSVGRKDQVLIVMRDDFSSLTNIDKTKCNEGYYPVVLRFIIRLADSGVKVRVRFHSSTPSSVLDKYQESLGVFDAVSFSDPRIPVWKEIKSCFPIFTYDSTGMLEFASIGSSFYAFIPDGIDGIKGTFRENYWALSSRGLLSTEIEEALNHILGLHANGFEFDSEAQRGISEFAQNLVYKPKSILRSLSNLLNNRTRPEFSERKATKWPRFPNTQGDS